MERNERKKGLFLSHSRVRRDGVIRQVSARMQKREVEVVNTPTCSMPTPRNGLIALLLRFGDFSNMSKRR